MKVSHGPKDHKLQDPPRPCIWTKEGLLPRVLAIVDISFMSSVSVLASWGQMTGLPLSVRNRCCLPREVHTESSPHVQLIGPQIASVWA